MSAKQLERYRRVLLPSGAAGRGFFGFCQMGQFEKMQIGPRPVPPRAARAGDALAKARAAGQNFLALATLQDARAAFAGVATEIGTQYSLGYYPTNKTRDGKFRAIRADRVQGAPAKSQVRAREGYYAPKG